jgi:vacuolar-type H+-ATPase subunit I/STV1
MYKLENELYGHQTTEIDEIKLLLTSDNIPRTLANDHLVKSMLLQFNDLMTNLDDTEDKQITLIKRLNKLKINAKNDVKDYGKQLEKLQQKKNYLIQFMELYKNDKFQSDAEIENLFNSVNDVYTAMAVMVDDIQEESYNVNFDVDDKFEELEELKEEEAKVNKHPIAWPVYPVSDIQTYFDDEDFLLRYGIHHIGLQIKAVQ